MQDLRDRTIGWGFVVIQAVLLIGLYALPSANHWPKPFWITLVATVLTWGGLFLAAVSAVHLGGSLTPTPTPKVSGRLQTGGLYQHVRHPIYFGLLVAVAGIVLGSANVVTIFAGGATYVFFLIKAKWEEHRLVERYPTYPEYASRTPRFFPALPWRRSQ